MLTTLAGGLKVRGMWAHFYVAIVLGIDGPPVIYYREGSAGWLGCVIVPRLLVFGRIFLCKHCIMYAQLGSKLGNGKQ